jgi:hypothetical protein
MAEHAQSDTAAETERGRMLADAGSSVSGVDDSRLIRTETA